MSRTQCRSSRRRAALALAATVVLGVGVGGSLAAHATVAPGTPGKDVTIGADNDNGDNPFVQPPGITGKHHTDNTDILFGRDNDDLLVVLLGSDTVLAGTGVDILVGGPEAGSTDPNSDALVGAGGDDVNVWAPGDGSEAFAGQKGSDTSIFAPFLLRSDGSLVLERFKGRKIPRVTIDGLPQFSCTIVQVPESENLGYEQLIRFNVDGDPVISLRHKEVERVLCPSRYDGKVQVAFPNSARPDFRDVPLARIKGVAGAIIAPSS
jgi:hypothetical protein